MISFKHLDLDTSESFYNGKRILVYKTINKDWEISVDGRKIKSKEPFSSRREAVNHIINVINKMKANYSGPTVYCDGCYSEIPLIPGVKICKKCGTSIKRPKVRRPPPCEICGSTQYPHRCMGPRIVK